MIAKQEIFNKFKSSLETGEQSETLDFDGYTTTSQYYAYLKFLKFYKLNPTITLEHGVLLGKQSDTVMIKFKILTYQLEVKF